MGKNEIILIGQCCSMLLASGKHGDCSSKLMHVIVYALVLSHKQLVYNNLTCFTTPIMKDNNFVFLTEPDFGQ